MNQEIGLNKPLLFIAGPCAIESYDLAMRVGEAIASISSQVGKTFVFKGSFDKANRTSGRSFRGLGMDEGLRILSEVQRQFGLPVLTDVHLPAQVETVAEVVDCIQTPAFLCRQTDLIEACAMSGKPVNIKKGQFLSPSEMAFVVDKARNAAMSRGHSEDSFLICERGVSFGYNDLVADMRALQIMRETHCPIIFDASHSAQSGRRSNREVGGCLKLVPLLARAAVAAGVSGVFIETHPTPERAWSDSTTQYPLAQLRDLVTSLITIDEVVKSNSNFVS